MYNGVSYRGGLIIQNCTFYNVANKGDMANWSGMLQNTTFMNISNNIFVDSGNNQVIRRITNNNNNVIKSFSRNSYWYGEIILQTDLLPLMNQIRLKQILN